MKWSLVRGIWRESTTGAYAYKSDGGHPMSGLHRGWIVKCKDKVAQFSTLAQCKEWVKGNFSKEDVK